MLDKIFIKIFAAVLERVFKQAEKLDLMTKTLKKCYTIRYIKGSWPKFLNSVHSFLQDAIREVERARKWVYED